MSGVRHMDTDLDLYVICSCGAEWWLDYEPPKCACSGDDAGSRLELRDYPHKVLKSEEKQ